MSQEIMHIAVNFVDILDVQKSCVNECNKCLKLKTELLKKKDLIENDVYDKLLKSYSTLEKQCISLELTTQLNQEVFQKDNFRKNQNAPTFNQLFELNELKAQSREKDTFIRKLKDRITSLSGKDSLKNVRKDIDEIETINIELEHSVAKLLSENENLRKEQERLKSIYKDQFDSIRKIRVQSKDHCESLIDQINAKSLENSDLNAQLQEKGMFKLDIEPISHRLKNNRDAHEVYIEKTIENNDTLHGFVERAKTQNPCESLLESACMFTKHVHELLVYVSQTRPNSPNLVRRIKPNTSASGSKPSGNTKNNKITRPASRNYKNKVEDHSRKVKSSLNKTNLVFEPISRTFTIVKNRFPSTRLTSTKVVPTKEISTKLVATPTQGILVYSWRPKATRSVGSSSKVKIVESKISNYKEPKQSWGSIVFNVPSSSLNDYRLSRFGNGHIAKIMGYGDYQMGNITISQIYYVEGLGRNLFSMGQFCDFNLEVAFRKHTCFIRDLDCVDLLKGYHGLKDQVMVVALKIITFKLRLYQFSCQTWYSPRSSKTKVSEGSFVLCLCSWTQPKLLTHGTISLGLVPNILSSTLYVPLTKNDWEILFQPMFDEYRNPPPCVDHQVLAVLAPEPTISTDTPSSTTIDQDAPSTSTSQTPPETSSLVIPLDVQEADHDIEVAHMDNNPFIEFLIPKPSFEESSTHMSMMGKLSFFLRLQISKSPRGIFLNQSKYALESIKKYGIETYEPADTPMVEKSKLDEDLQGKAVDPIHYRGMIGTLMYLIVSRPDLVFVIALTAFTDADHAGCQDTRKSTSRSIQLLGNRLVSWSSKKQKSIAISSSEAEYIALSDIFTKPFARERLEFLIKKLGMQSMSPETLKKLADEEEE
nr:hypothetical protein [Tanacetum cinerariifolium]